MKCVRFSCGLLVLALGVFPACTDKPDDLQACPLLREEVVAAVLDRPVSPVQRERDSCGFIGDPSGQEITPPSVTVELLSELESRRFSERMNDVDWTTGDLGASSAMFRGSLLIRLDGVVAVVVAVGVPDAADVQRRLGRAIVIAARG